MKAEQKRKEVERMLQSIDTQSFWNKVERKISADAENYRLARVRSRECNHVFV